MFSELVEKLIYLPFLLASNLVFMLALSPLPKQASLTSRLFQGSGVILTALLPISLFKPWAAILWILAILGWGIIHQLTSILTVPFSLRKFLTIFPTYFLSILFLSKWGTRVHLSNLQPVFQQLAAWELSPSLLWNILVITFGGLWCLWGGTVFVRTILDPYAKTQSMINDDELRRGRMIGNMERLLIYFLGLSQIWSLASVTVAVKAVARFKKLEEKSFAEYFLIGTLASLLYAVGVVVIVQTLLVQP